MAGLCHGNWRRVSSDLWWAPEGDIQAAYSAESFPRVAACTHEGRLFTCCSVHYHGPIHAEADCSPLIPPDEYRGPHPGCIDRHRFGDDHRRPRGLFVTVMGLMLAHDGAAPE